MKDEIADCFIYLLMLTDDLELDLEQIIIEKLKKNKEKYPISKSKNSNKKYTEL